MQHLKTLEEQFLIAMPSLDDTYFEKTVVFVVEHDKDGAMGIVVNIPGKITYKGLLDHLEIETALVDAEKKKILKGGPLSPERGFVLQEEKDSIFVSASLDTLGTVAKNEKLDKAIVALGYTGWGPGQLEEEIRNNDWLLTPMREDILFDVPPQQRWKTAISDLGVKVEQLSGDAGRV